MEYIIWVMLKVEIARLCARVIVTNGRPTERKVLLLLVFKYTHYRSTRASSITFNCKAKNKIVSSSSRICTNVSARPQIMWKRDDGRRRPSTCHRL